MYTDDNPFLCDIHYKTVFLQSFKDGLRVLIHIWCSTSFIDLSNRNYTLAMKKNNIALFVDMLSFHKICMLCLCHENSEEKH